ncbi:MAG: S-layer homology domain-containing protein [Patescibacteria group bacterium]
MSGKKVLNLLLIPILLVVAIVSQLRQQPAMAEDFTDVKAGYKYFVAISYLKNNGTIVGYEDNTFKPNQKVTRAEALKLLIGGEIEEETGEQPDQQIDPQEDISKRPFTDTPLNKWYIPYLITAKENGMVNGYPDGTFKPDNTINLAEMLKIYLESIAETEGIVFETKESNLFNDTPLDSWYTKYTAYAGEKGIINIYSNNTINPEQELTRGYLAEIIYRMEMSKQGYVFGKASWYKGRKDDSTTYTTAHKTLPWGTIVEVTDLSNGKTVQVKVNDRGPYVPGRVLDLSKVAFGDLIEPSLGITTVQFRIISTP